jgi:hypothetical protein
MISMRKTVRGTLALTEAYQCATYNIESLSVLLLMVTHFTCLYVTKRIVFDQLIVMQLVTTFYAHIEPTVLLVFRIGLSEPV